MKRRGSRRQAIWWGLSAMIVVSMVCSLVLFISPLPAPGPAPAPAAAPPATAALEPSAVTPPAGPAPGEAGEFTFAVAGDSEGGEETFRQIIRRVSAEQPAFLLHTGDLVASGLKPEYEALLAILAELTVPLRPVPGDRDSATGTLDLYLRYTGVPAACYAFDYGQAHFALADTHLADLGPTQLALLDADLAATQQPLKIVVLHHPPFDPAGSTRTMRTDNDAFMALVKKHGVRYVFAGHLHGFAHEMRDGVTYIITGGGGAPLDPGQYHHYLRVRVHGQDLTYEVVRIE